LERPISVWSFEFPENSARHVTVLRLAERTPDAFFSELRNTAGRSKQTFVFVHGYNNSFAEALRRTGQLAYDLQLEGAILYSWPSKGNPLEYVADHDEAEWTVPHLVEFLKELRTRFEGQTIHLVAHSMGNQAMTAALRILARDPDVGKTFKQVVLTAPDLDAATFLRDIAPEIISTAERTTLYASSRDEVLRAAKKLHAGRRAGDTTDGIVIVKGMDSIDATDVDTGLGHSYVGDVRSVVDDISQLLRNGLPPPQRNLRRRGTPPQEYWAVPR